MAAESDGAGIEPTHRGNVFYGMVAVLRLHDLVVQAGESKHRLNHVLHQALRGAARMRVGVAGEEKGRGPGKQWRVT